MPRDVSRPVRWVVLHHTAFPGAHYDLMYEEQPGSALTTWRIPQWPVREYVICTPLGAHRREYLEYEGPLSNGRGVVRRLASGSCVIETLTDQQTAYHIELLPEPEKPMVILELRKEGWVAVPLDPPAYSVPPAAGA